MSESKTGGKRRKESGKVAGGQLDLDRVRSVAASVVWIVAIVAAAFLAVGALLIVLDFNRDNAFVDFVTSTADSLNFLGTLKEFEPSGNGEDARQSALVKTVLVNWGIAALVYIFIGKVLERVIRP
jgi:hypothetical protein